MRDRDYIYQDILHCLRGRWNRARWRADRRAAEKVAIHMALILPLLRCSDERHHRHYLEVVKPRYLRGAKTGDAEELFALWAELANVIAPPLPTAAIFGIIDKPIPLDYRSPHCLKRSELRRDIARETTFVK